MQPFVFYLSGNLEQHMLPCVSKKFFGLHCPGCGLQRSVLLLFEGEFIAAFTMYPAIYTLIPLFFLLIVDRFSRAKSINFLVIAFSAASVALILINFIIKLIH